MQPIQVANRVTEAELQLFPAKTPRQLGLTGFSKAMYTYRASDPRNIAKVESIIDDISQEVLHGANYYFLRPTSPFVAKERGHGQLEWVSVDVVTASQVEAIGKSMIATRDQSFYINTGSHGDSSGNSIQNRPALGAGSPSPGTFIIEDLHNFFKTDNVGLYIVPPGLEIRRPANVNQNMIAWCFSYRTAQRVDQIASDLQQHGSMPEEYRCSLRGRVMVVPVKFDSCLHMFEKAVIEEQIYHYRLNTCPAKTGWFSSCGKPISPDTMSIDLLKKRQIDLFLQERETLNQTTQEVTVLRSENSTLAQEITTLTEDNHQKDQTIVELTGRVTNLTDENQDLQQALTVEKRDKKTVTLENKTLKEDLETIRQNPNSLESVVLNQSQAIREAKQREINEKIARLQSEIDSRELKKSLADREIVEAQSSSWKNAILSGTVGNLCLGVFLAGSGPLAIAGALAVGTVNVVRGTRKNEELLEKERIAKEEKVARDLSIERKRREIRNEELEESKE